MNTPAPSEIMERIKKEVEAELKLENIICPYCQAVQDNKTIKKYSRKHKYFTVSTRLNYFEAIAFRKLQVKYKLSSSEIIKKLIFQENKENRK